MSSINVFLSMSNTTQSGQTGSALGVPTLHRVPNPGSNGSHFGGGHGPRFKQGGRNQSSHCLVGPDGIPVASVDIRPVHVHQGHTGQPVHVHQGHTGQPVHVHQGHTGQPVHVHQGHTGQPVHVPQIHGVITGQNPRLPRQPVHVPQGHTGRRVQATSVGVVSSPNVGIVGYGGIPVGVSYGGIPVGVSYGGIPVGVSYGGIPVGVSYGGNPVGVHSGATIQYGNGPMYGLGP